MNPLLAVWTAVNRFAEDDKTVVAPDERIGVERALRAITIDAAYIIGMEDRIGSLEQGKFADFTILDEDPFEVDLKHIKDIRLDNVNDQGARRKCRSSGRCWRPGALDFTLSRCRGCLLQHRHPVG